MVWNILFPALGAKSLPEDAAAYDKLAKKLSSLTMLPVQGKASSAQAAKVSGRTYKVDANELKIETIALNFTGSGCTRSPESAASSRKPISTGYKRRARRLMS